MKLKLEDFKRSEEKPAIELYYDGIRAQATRFSYTTKLRFLLCHVFHEIFGGSFEERAQQLVEKTREDPAWTVDLFLNFMELCKKRTSLPKEHPDYLNPSTIPTFLKPVKKLFRMNGVDISWARVHASLPEINDKEKARGYEREEIKEMLKATANSTYRAVILVASSAGIRAGAFDFAWQDMMPVYRQNGQLRLETDDGNAEVACVAILIYRGSRSAYLAFITPEAYDAVLEHRKKWVSEVGREPSPEEPVFKKMGKYPKPLSPDVVREQVNRILLKSGVRVRGKKRRHEVPTMNGFRKFWNKKVKETKSKDSALASLIKKEYMMGHEGLISMDKHYFQTSVLELAEEYLMVVPELTITDEYRLKADNVKLKKERDEVLGLAREAVDERDKAIEALRKQLKHNDFL